ncbi:MAG: dihydroxyacetone kinase subunit DhaK [Christensenella sp.]|uniref:dihydroxyacetone kinase subunit DhaK n=1 Tax=Christensenella sp. TaxID=1935934 RepID=UPI002B1FBD9E|nr:dihydroxyacetone kinase subunit DhaK [Christensenella sp.]MEA5004192.1 dihydroxyacetone kinase subunit DhaK [Christensenella sp.]
MQRILKDADRMVEDMLEGYLKANAFAVEATDDPRVIKSTCQYDSGKVGVVTGGGSGHEPAFLGYVGKNMLDAVAVGEIFSSPTAKSFFNAIKEADRGNGVACLYGNYAGDNMNVKMAVRMAQKEGITVKTVVANDDVASAPKDEQQKRRGVAGEIMMWKCGGAMAAKGASLDEVIRVAQKAVDNTKSIGIGLTSCTIPAVGHPNFTIADGMMELGIGHHGEAGVDVAKVETADKIAQRMWDIIKNEAFFAAGDEVVVLVSGLGATPVMEQYILFGEAASLIEKDGINIHRSYVGNLFTSLEMMGATLTVMKLDNELKELMDMEASCSGLVSL